MQLNLTKAQTEALQKLEKRTGRSSSELLDDYLKQQNYKAWLHDKVSQADSDIQSNRVYLSDEVFSQAVAAITEVSK